MKAVYYLIYVVTIFILTIGNYYNNFKIGSLNYTVFKYWLAAYKKGN